MVYFEIAFNAVCACVSLCMLNIAKGGASICVVKNGWNTIKKDRDKLSLFGVLWHMIIHTFSVCSLM